MPEEKSRLIFVVVKGENNIYRYDPSQEEGDSPEKVLLHHSTGVTSWISTKKVVPLNLLQGEELTRLKRKITKQVDELITQLEFYEQAEVELVEGEVAAEVENKNW